MKRLVIISMLALVAGVMQSGTSHAECIQGDCIDGQGVSVLPNGARYEGEWENGMKHGQGVNVWADGERYEGNWENHKKHGQGRLTYPDGAYYVVTWENDEPKGKGVMTYPDGRKYEGDFLYKVYSGK